MDDNATRERKREQDMLEIIMMMRRREKWWEWWWFWHAMMMVEPGGGGNDGLSTPDAVDSITHESNNGSPHSLVLLPSPFDSFSWEDAFLMIQVYSLSLFPINSQQLWRWYILFCKNAEYKELLRNRSWENNPLLYIIDYLCFFLLPVIYLSYARNERKT